MVRFILALAVGLPLAVSAEAAVQTKKISYKDGDVTCNGMLAWDDAVQGPRPGVLVIHEW